MQDNGLKGTLDRRRFARLPETNILVDRLLTLSEGEVIPTADVEQILGRHGIDAVGLARSACRAVESQGIHCRYCPALYGGLRRLTPGESCERATMSVSRVHRTAKRELNRLVFVPFDRLNPDERRQHMIASSCLGALSLFSGQKAVKQLASVVQDKPLDVGETLKLFQK